MASCVFRFPVFFLVKLCNLKVLGLVSRHELCIPLIMYFFCLASFDSFFVIHLLWLFFFSAISVPGLGPYLRRKLERSKNNILLNNLNWSAPAVTVTDDLKTEKINRKNILCIREKCLITQATGPLGWRFA